MKRNAADVFRLLGPFPAWVEAGTMEGQPSLEQQIRDLRHELANAQQAIDLRRAADNMRAERIKQARAHVAQRLGELGPRPTDTVDHRDAARAAIIDELLAVQKVLSP